MTQLKTREKRMLETCGVQIPFDPQIITPAIEAAIQSGYFEAEEAANIPNIVEAGDVVLDIGAGIGFISTLLARQEGVKKVISVEANPDLLPFMEYLHKINNVSKIDRINAVLTNSNANQMTFYQRKDFWMGSLAAGPNPFDKAISVPTLNFNYLLKTQKVSLVVCDIEGAETVIFDGADLAGVERIYLELHDHITGLCGIRSVFERLTAAGFSYDPRYSNGAIVLFRRADTAEVLRPYARL